MLPDSTIEHLPSIRDANYATFCIKRKSQTPKERAEEDLNDKKAAWLSVVYMKKKSELTEREKRFIKEYEEQNIHFSLHWQYKQEILQFIEEQKVKLLGKQK